MLHSLHVPKCFFSSYTESFEELESCKQEHDQLGSLAEYKSLKDTVITEKILMSCHHPNTSNSTFTVHRHNFPHVQKNYHWAGWVHTGRGHVGLINRRTTGRSTDLSPDLTFQCNVQPGFNSSAHWEMWRHRRRCRWISGSLSHAGWGSWPLYGWRRKSTALIPWRKADTKLQQFAESSEYIPAGSRVGANCHKATCYYQEVSLHRGLAGQQSAGRQTGSFKPLY